MTLDEILRKLGPNRPLNTLTYVAKGYTLAELIDDLHKVNCRPAPPERPKELSMPESGF
jgi:hypothetical protein